MTTIKHKHCTETCKLCNSMRNTGKEQMKEEVKKLIDKYILTDVQGRPLPQCKILWELKEEINGK